MEVLGRARRSSHRLRPACSLPLDAPPSASCSNRSHSVAGNTAFRADTLADAVEAGLSATAPPVFWRLAAAAPQEFYDLLHGGPVKSSRCSPRAGRWPPTRRGRGRRRALTWPCWPPGRPGAPQALCLTTPRKTLAASSAGTYNPNGTRHGRSRCPSSTTVLSRSLFSFQGIRPRTGIGF